MAVTLPEDFDWHHLAYHRKQKPLALIMSKIDYRDPNGCWLWHGTIIRGYGFKQIAGKLRLAHRLMFEIYYGPIPEGLDLDHICRVRNCVNPEHLEPVTEYENTRRGMSPGMVNRRRSHCINGHEWNAENLYIVPSTGVHHCRPCNRAAHVRLKARRKGKV